MALIWIRDYVTKWALVAEVLILDEQILGINDLGEGLPMENTKWMWVVVDSEQ